MKQLETFFEGKGEVSNRTFIQLDRTDIAAIYKIEMNDKSQTYYEVFEIKRQKKGEMKMQDRVIQLEAKELYPKSTAFGQTAWCFIDLNMAFDKFQFIKNHVHA